MTFDAQTGTLSATPSELITLIKSAKFNTRLNQDYNKAQIDMLTKYGTSITPGQSNWLIKTRINYANKASTPNQINAITNRQTVNSLYLVD